MNVTGKRYGLPLTESYGKTPPPVLSCLVRNCKTDQLCGRVGEPLLGLVANTWGTQGTLRPRGHHGSVASSPVASSRLSCVTWSFWLTHSPLHLK